jgi:hypothetical protein
VVLKERVKKRTIGVDVMCFISWSMFSSALVDVASHIVNFAYGIVTDFSGQKAVGIVFK